MVLLPRWLDLILSGEKTLELRHQRRALGFYWLATGGIIYGSVQIVNHELIATVEDFKSKAALHRVYTDKLPYRGETWGLALSGAQRLTSPVVVVAVAVVFVVVAVVVVVVVTITIAVVAAVAVVTITVAVAVVAITVVLILL